ncbi:MAG: tyrosine-type recombinase/integrase [Taibaiella sp.]|nr:tyrosine-type recombinase/integrase [Taibaiella sp.]
MKLTQSAIRAMTYDKSDNKADLRFDDELRGFGVRIYPSGRKSFFISYRNMTGTKKRHTVGNFGTITLKQAYDLARRKLVEVTSGGDPAKERTAQRNEMTFGDVASRYINYAKDHNKRSIGDDFQRLRDHILPAIGKMKLSEISLVTLERLHADIKHKTSASTANRCAALFKKILNQAIEWSLIEKSPAQHLKMFKEPPPRDIFLNRDQCKQLIDACSQDDNVYMCSLFLLAMFTGRRIGEIITAKWSDIDLGNRIWTFPSTKAGEQQRIPINNAVRDILTKTPRVVDNPHLIVGAKPGAHVVHYRRAWNRILKQANIEPFPPHGLRHNYASTLVADGVHMAQVQSLLGHKSSLTTQKYAHHQHEDLMEASNRFGRRIGKTQRRNNNN